MTSSHFSVWRDLVRSRLHFRIQLMSRAVKAWKIYFSTIKNFVDGLADLVENRYMRRLALHRWRRCTRLFYWTRFLKWLLTIREVVIDHKKSLLLRLKTFQSHSQSDALGSHLWTWRQLCLASAYSKYRLHANAWRSWRAYTESLIIFINRVTSALGDKHVAR
jgi:hypothetical protein